MNKVLTIIGLKSSRHHKILFYESQENSFVKEKIFLNLGFILQKGNLFLVFLLHELVLNVILKLETEGGLKLKILQAIKKLDLPSNNLPVTTLSSRIIPPPVHTAAPLYHNIGKSIQASKSQRGEAIFKI
jgi:hypothetical protein